MNPFKKTRTPVVEAKPEPLPTPNERAPVVPAAPPATQLDRIEAMLKKVAARLQC